MLPADFIAELRPRFSGDIRNDDASRILYSTDASIYQIEPLGVVLPRTQNDLHAAVELAARHRIPVLARGSGSSLAGQAIGPALIVDCSRWLDGLVEIDAEKRTATVEPGIILSALNRAAAKYGLQYGPDPASAERATMGGVIANNATGAHSILYGMTADHLLSADVILADGSLATLGEERLDRPPDGSLYGSLFSAALQIRMQNASLIEQHYPRSWRNSAGYRLNYLLPWSATQPAQWIGGSYPPASAGTLNLAPLLAGSEGTLAVIRRATVRLVPKPRFSVLGILAYADVGEACDAVPGLLAHEPSAIELLPRTILQLARTVPGYASKMGWVSGDPGALLIVEFSGDQLPPLVEAARRLREDVLIAASPEEQGRVWAVRKAGLGILDAGPSSARPAAFIEDCAIPVEHLGEFVREIEAILRAYRTEGGIYAHASAGTLHIRPILDLKSAEGVQALRPIAEQVLALTLRLGGAMSSEHGDGIARGEWLKATYGPEVVELMRTLKRSADPHNLLNPGKMFDAPPMNTHLRYGPGYHARPWAPALDLRVNGGLAIAIEQCNGQGVCRKDTGAMCPSFQATREEMHSTRGRANLLRALITRGTPSADGEWDSASEQRVHEALDLCLMCKGCKAECPSGVDMAKLKSEFLSQYYRRHRRPLRDYVFGYFHITARVLSAFAPLVNFAAGLAPLYRPATRLLGVTPNRPFPRFAMSRTVPEHRARRSDRSRVLYLPDAFSHYVEPELERTALRVLDRGGFDAVVLRSIGAGAALLSKGFVAAARSHSGRLLDEIQGLDPRGELPLVCIEPPELHMLRHEYGDLHPGRVDAIASRAFGSRTVEELLLGTRINKMRVGIQHTKVFFHPHCHQKAEAATRGSALTGTEATLELLRICGYDVELSDAGCCGMAGTFGYEAEHYALSQQVGELKLFPRLRSEPGLPIAASGSACRMQISQALGCDVHHPLVLVERALNS